MEFYGDRASERDTVESPQVGESFSLERRIQQAEDISVPEQTSVFRHGDVSVHLSDTYTERTHGYTVVQETISNLDGAARDVKFFGVAAGVTDSLSAIDNNPFADYVLTNGARDYLGALSGQLQQENLAKAQELADNPHRLQAPDGSDAEVGSAFEWDLQMVKREQQLAEGQLRQWQQDGRLTIEDVRSLSDSMNFESVDRQRDFVLNSAQIVGMRDKSLAWAQDAVGGRLEYGKMEHRVAVGHAYIFEAHGYSEEQYQRHVRYRVLPK